MMCNQVCSYDEESRAQRSSSQLVKNGTYKTKDRESHRLVNKEVALKSWLYKFLSSCSQHLKLPKFSRRTAVVAIPKPKKAQEI